MTKKDYDLIGNALKLEIQAVNHAVVMGDMMDSVGDTKIQAIQNVGYRLNGLLAEQDSQFSQFKFKQIWGGR
jgi:hypothetical protein